MITATLHPLTINDDGPEIAVSKARFVIGRASDCDLVVSCCWVSRHHCQIVIHEDDVEIRDLDSKNGTHVNGERIEGVRILSSGEWVGLGTRIYRIQIERSLSNLRVESKGASPLLAATAC
jgi:pSer/pThr/pTyr-binding forkhead associated (FHA) protein